jgi:Tol biopolymer transport system component
MRKMLDQNRKLLLTLICLPLGTCFAHGQTFVYSGREYLKTGKSYPQIRMMDIPTGKSAQLSKSARDHAIPWCTSDGSIYFTSYDEKAIYRLDRDSGNESKVMPIARDISAFIGELDDRRIVVQEVGHDFEIEILDLKAGRSIRIFDGVSASISPDHKAIAYQYPPLDSDVASHVYVAEIESGKILDLGKGATPAFFPTGGKLAYTLPPQNTNLTQIKTIIYDLKTGSKDSRIFSAKDEIFSWFTNLTIAPDGLTMILGNASGGHGSDVYYLLRSGTATIIDQYLQGWAGWSANGLLLYATEEEIRALDSHRQVWVNDIKAFDFHTGKARTLIKGISANIAPCWCTSSSN